MKLELHGVGVAYGGRPVVEGVDFTLDPGTIGCLLGPSGCGKTSLLRAICGLEPLAHGAIVADGATISTPAWRLAVERRGIGMVFQDLGLLPHLDIAGNVGFGLPRGPAAERAARVRELLELMGLADCARQFPHALSGGMQQRVALARALAPRPRLLLLDEPFASLDPALREHLGFEVRDVLQRTGTTALLVTHSQAEAFTMADRVGVMRAGRLLQWTTPYAVYHQPGDRFVARFVGEGVLLPGTSLGDGRLACELGEMHSRDRGIPPGAAVEILLRPDDVVHDEGSSLRAIVTRKAFRGAEFLYTLRTAAGAELQSLLPSHQDFALGAAIGVRLDLEHVVAFRADPAAVD
jgi:iron(III) transport system ATP-binding protein